MATGPLSSLLEGSCATWDVPTRQAASTVKQTVAAPVTQKYHGLYPPLVPQSCATRAGCGSSPLAPLHTWKKAASVKLQPPRKIRLKGQ